MTGTEHLTGKLDRAQTAVSEALDRTQSAIVAVAASTAETIDQLGETSAHPGEMTVTFGLKFSVQAYVIAAGGSGEATLEASLTCWRGPGRKSAHGDGQREAAGAGSGNDT